MQCALKLKLCCYQHWKFIHEDLLKVSDKIYFCTRCNAHFMTLTLMEFNFHPGKQQLYAMHFKVQYTNSAKLVQQFPTKQFHSILRHVNTGKRIVKDSRQNNTTLQSTSILFSYRIRACVCLFFRNNFVFVI